MTNEKAYDKLWNRARDVLLILIVAGGALVLMSQNSRRIDQSLLIPSARDQVTELVEAEMEGMDLVIPAPVDRLDDVPCGTECQIAKCQADPGCATRLALDLPPGYHVLRTPQEDSYTLTASPNPDRFAVISESDLLFEAKQQKDKAKRDILDRLAALEQEKNRLIPRVIKKRVAEKMVSDRLGIYIDKIERQAEGL